MLDWKNSIWFFDIDDTLIDTAGSTPKASEGIRDVFTHVKGEESAQKVYESFNNLFDLMLAGYRVKNDNWSSVSGGKEAFDELLSKVEELQPQVIKDYGHAKKWSREIFVALACDEVGVACDPELIHNAADAYWKSLTENTTIYEGVISLFAHLKEVGRPVYFITSSDARLKMTSSGLFEYIPERSEKLKRERIEILSDKGLWFDGLSIGDPEDKPDVEFFEKGIGLAKKDLTDSFSYENSIMIGDSFAGDLQTPKEKLNFGLIVLFEKGRTEKEIVDDREIHVGNLLDVMKLLH